MSFRMYKLSCFSVLSFYGVTCSEPEAHRDAQVCATVPMRNLCARGLGKGWFPHIPRKSRLNNVSSQTVDWIACSVAAGSREWGHIEVYPHIARTVTLDS